VEELTHSLPQSLWIRGPLLGGEGRKGRGKERRGPSRRIKILATAAALLFTKSSVLRIMSLLNKYVA